VTSPPDLIAEQWNKITDANVVPKANSLLEQTNKRNFILNKTKSSEKVFVVFLKKKNNLKR
jgi:hypothetical protein